MGKLALFCAVKDFRGVDQLIKQMDEMISGLSVVLRRTRRITKYWGGNCKPIFVATLLVWVIPYTIYRRYENWIEKKNMQSNSRRHRPERQSRNTY